MARRELFLSQRPDHWEDGWTYGDWRQYIARRPDGALQCCRVSGVPFFVAVLGLVLVALAMTGGFVGLQDPDAVHWPRIIAMGALGTLALTVPLLMHWHGICLMVSVGPRQYEKDGHFRRIFNHEVRD